MKHSKLVVFLSLLLVAIMAFSSCSGSAAIPENEQLNNAPTEDSIELLGGSSSSGSDDSLKADIATNKTAIAAAVSKWQEYLGFKQNSLGVDDEQIAKEIVTNYDRVSFERKGAIIIVRAEEDVWDYTEEDYVLSAKRLLVYNLYNENFEVPVFDSGDYKDWEQSPEVNYVTYTVSANQYFSAFRILKTEYVAKFEASEADPTVSEFKEYEAKYTTTFYNTEAFYTEDEIVNWSYNQMPGYFEVTIEDKVYAMDSEGKILKIFNEGLQYLLPVYADYEIGGLKYYFEDEYVYVLDENFAFVSSYEFLKGYEASAQNILPNGNIFFQYAKPLDADAEDFDIEQNGIKVDFVQQIYNVKTGAVTELENGYLINDIYTSDDAPFTIKNEENFVVDAAVISGGKFSLADEDLVTLVFKGDFELVAELPEIIENQVGMPDFVAMNQLIVTTSFASGEEFNVLVGTDGSYKLLPYGVSFGKTRFNFDGETYVYNTNSNGEFVTPFDGYDVLTSFNDTTVLLVPEDLDKYYQDYVRFYYYSESENRYAYRDVNAEGYIATVGSLVLLDLGDGDYAWYDAYGYHVVNTESSYYYSVADGIMLQVVHSSSTETTYKYYFVK